MNRQKTLVLLLANCTLICALGSFTSYSIAQGGGVPETIESDESTPEKMLVFLLARLSAEPERSDTWRLLGRVYLRQGNLEKAAESIQQSLKLYPENAAAHFDMGQLQAHLGNDELAKSHYEHVLAFAPDSEYASKTTALGIRLTRNKVDLPKTDFPVIHAAEFAKLDPTLGKIEQASYEITTFDGANKLEQRIARIESDTSNPDKRFGAIIETGVLYNSNVTLTPISRELTNPAISSAQLIFNPELEYAVQSFEIGSIGLIGRGYFTVNESNTDEFDLVNLQPGAYYEREIVTDGDQLSIIRGEYVYAFDSLDGTKTADRHSLNGSLTRIQANGNIGFGFVSVATSEFEDDGLIPAIDSLDGVTVSVGVSKFFTTGSKGIPTYSLGLSGELTDTEGADFRYYSARFHGDVTWMIGDKWRLVPNGAIGLQTYPNFTGAVSRDEFSWRAGARLSRELKSSMKIALVFDYNRSATDNPEFDTDRFTTGIIYTSNY